MPDLNKIGDLENPRLIGARHEAARILIWVREEIGRIREVLRLLPEHHVRLRKQAKANLEPLERLGRRIEQAHSFPSKKDPANV